MKKIKITIAQVNPTVGDLSGNLKKISKICSSLSPSDVDLVAFPEMFVTGYQAHDLILKKAFLLDVEEKINRLIQEVNQEIGVLFGAPAVYEGQIFNAYYLINGGSLTVVSRKHHLPNINVFDEKRVFASCEQPDVFSFRGIKIGSPICEDVWYPDVVDKMIKKGAELLISPNGSPYARGKAEIRANLIRERSDQCNVPIIYLNLVGGQDDLIFDGNSFVMNPGGQLVARLPQFEEIVGSVCFEKVDNKWLANSSKISPIRCELSQDYRAMAESLKDYVQKSGFSKVLLGLSGGVDSALVAVIACDALGPENVLCVRLPSEFSSYGSLNDAKDLVKRLGCSNETIGISHINNEIKNVLSDFLKGNRSGLAEENMQSRLRGLLLMALSNELGMMLLTTGNKSEVAVGYSTIYGDMAGGYNPIKDLYKTRVFEVCNWRNTNFESWMSVKRSDIIPKAIIEKPPSAELRPDQRDDDTLPPYEILDPILTGLIDEDLSTKDLVKSGFDENIVKHVENMVYQSEYKRFQSAPGTHLTDRSFWSSRRYPLVQKWRDNS